MKNIEVITRMANAEVMIELVDYRDGIERDLEEWPEGYTLVDALDDLVTRCEGNDWRDVPRTMKMNLRAIEIGLHRYVEVSDAELARTVSTGKKYAFVHYGKKYRAA